MLKHGGVPSKDSVHLCALHFLGNQCILKYQLPKPIRIATSFQDSIFYHRKKPVWLGSGIHLKILLKRNHYCSEWYRKISTVEKFYLPVTCNRSDVWPFNIFPIGCLRSNSLKKDNACQMDTVFHLHLILGFWMYKQTSVVWHSLVYSCRFPEINAQHLGRCPMLVYY